MATARKFKIESGVQLLARLSKKPQISNFFPILFEPGLKYSDTVEITSEVNISYLLIDLICEALLSRDINEDSMGVLMLNTAGHFNYEEFVKILQKRIYSSFDERRDSQKQIIEIDKLLCKALSKFHLLEIYDATQFYTTIHNLDNVFLKHSDISLVVFDALTAYYWSEQGFKVTKMDSYIKNILTMIKKVTKEYKIILVYARSKYFSSSKDTDNFEVSDVADSVDYKVKLTCDNDGIHEVSVKTSKVCYKKYFNIINNVIKWSKS